MKGWIKFVAFGLILLALGTYLLLSDNMHVYQNYKAYFPDSQDFDSCPGFAESEKIREGSTRMYYTYTDSDTLIVYYHGNAGSACDRAFVKDKLSEEGYSSLFVEYAGFSADEKEPSTDLILKDVENADKFLKSRSFKKTILMGTSLGSGIAAYHQTLSKPDKMVLFTPYDKFSNVGKKHYPHLPVKTLMSEEYEADVWMKDYTGEIIIIHGTRDEVIPIKYAEAFYKAIPSDKKIFHAVEGETHNTILNNTEVWDVVMDFIKK